MGSPVIPELLASERLRLPLWTAEEVADLRVGRRRPTWHADYPGRDEVAATALWSAGDTWGRRSIVRGHTVLGSIGFYGPPQGDPPEADIAFSLVAEAEGYGFGTEAFVTVLAATDEAGVVVRAAVRPEDRDRLRVLAAAGFTELRGSDEDGQLVMARPLP